MAHRRYTIGLSLILGIILGGCSLGAPASAHVLKQNQGIYVVMHIDPDDDPKAGELTTILLDIGANQGVFRLSDCDCKATVYENGKVIDAPAMEAAFFGTNNQAITKTTFPKPDVYELEVTGTPKTKDFQAFKLKYLIRVATAVGPAATTKNDGIAVIMVSATSLAVVGVLAYLQIGQGARYKPRKAHSKFS